MMNMFGLVVGLTCIMVVGIYARYELGYDKSLDKSESIYRLVKDYRSNLYSTVAFSNYFRATREEQLELPVALRELPGVEEVAQFHIVQTPTYIDVGSTRYVEERVLIPTTGPQFFDLYWYSFIEGSSEAALRAPRRVMVFSLRSKSAGLKRSMMIAASGPGPSLQRWISLDCRGASQSDRAGWRRMWLS